MASGVSLELSMVSRRVTMERRRVGIVLILGELHLLSFVC